MSQSLSRRAFLALGGGLFAQTPQKPNILLILCDDLGYGDVQAYYPESKIPTPHMDRLAREGMRFTDAHSPSSVCTPTRYGLLTGRYCWRTRMKSGVGNGYSPALIEPDRATIASLLKSQRNYRTGGFGKWHLGLGNDEKVDFAKPFTPSPNDFGFDEFFGIPASLDMPPYVFIDNHRAVEPPTSTIADNGEIKRGPYWRGGPRAPSFQMEEVVPAIVKRACEFVEKEKGPFFAYVPLPAPHTPWVPSKPYQGKSKAGLYGDFVEETDASIGKILESLERTGKAKNTLVIVTSDNGAPWEERDSREAIGHWANATWRGQKADIQEAGHRVPFMVRWPGMVKPGTTSSQTICLTDVFATIAQIQGIPLTDTMGEDSVSLLNILTGKQRGAAREAVVHHSASGVFAIRQGDWKLVLGRGSGGFSAPVKIVPKPGEPTVELYNLLNDPHEDHNVYDSNPKIVARLTALLQRYQDAGHSR
jgi:arylsulfatase A-like enzyme